MDIKSIIFENDTFKLGLLWYVLMKTNTYIENNQILDYELATDILVKENPQEHLLTLLSSRLKTYSTFINSVGIVNAKSNILSLDFVRYDDYLHYSKILNKILERIEIMNNHLYNIHLFISKANEQTTLEQLVINICNELFNILCNNESKYYPYLLAAATRVLKNYNISTTLQQPINSTVVEEILCNTL